MALVREKMDIHVFCLGFRFRGYTPGSPLVLFIASAAYGKGCRVQCKTIVGFLVNPKVQFLIWGFHARKGHVIFGMPFFAGGRARCSARRGSGSAAVSVA